MISQNIQDTRLILEKLDLHHDQFFVLEMSKVEIEYSGMQLNYSNEYVEDLHNIHADNIKRNLTDIVQSALGYYALVEQPLGTNEPVIGPLFAQELLNNIQLGDLDLIQIKDNLFEQINSKILL